MKAWTIVDKVRAGDAEYEVRTRIKARSEDELYDKIEGHVPTVVLDGREVYADEVLSTEVEGRE
jgi:hypothetical protein